MGNLYTTIESLCRQKKVNISEMCRASGASRGSLTDLKMGRTSTLSSATLSKIADYFGVTIDDLYERSGGKLVTDDEIKFALFGGDVSDEMFEEVKAFAEFVKSRKK